MQDTTAPQATRKQKGKPPAFQFYAKDWLSSGAVRTMTLAARGLFIDLLAFAWDNHGLPTELPTDPAMARRLFGVSTREWNTNWPRVRNQFEVRNGFLVNPKQERVRDAMNRLSVRMTTVAERRWQCVEHAAAHAQLHAPAMPSPAPATALALGGRAGASSGLEIRVKQPPRRPAPDDEGFTAFWAAYPRRVGKGGARRAWAKIRPDPGLVESMLGAVEQQRDSWQWRRDNGQFVPHPATWLNERRWEDEPEPASAPALRPEDEEWKREKARLRAGLIAEGKIRP